MFSSKIAIVGSTNMDMVVRTERIPVPGETTLASQFFMNPGGKGANQAVTVARLGGSALFFTKMGSDVFGRQSSRLFDEEGIDSRFMLEDPELPSGVALITVDKDGENSIVVNQGANKALLPDDFTEYLLHELAQCKMVLMQFEIPMQTVQFIARYAASRGLNVIINPAPVQELPETLYPYIDILTPNRIEAGLLANVEIKDLESAKTAAKILLGRGIKKVIITLGADGALIGDDNGMILIPAVKVNPVDTTAAGDVFNGALVVALANEKSVSDATRFACRAAALSTTRQGAQASIPYYNEVISGVIR